MKSVIAAVLATASLVSGHAAIIAATSDLGGQGMALGIVSTTPRDGTRRDPFQADSTRFKQNAGVMGETIGAGQNNLEAGTAAIMAETGAQLPQVQPGSTVTMTVHQVNADGGGPMTCGISADGTGNNFATMQITTNTPGRNSNNRQGAMTDFPLMATVPAGTQCTGNVAGQDNVCLVKCSNAARAGPFGGIVPVQMANTTTPAAARRALALHLRSTEMAFAKRQPIVEDDDEEEE